jgi:uncharacterized protein (DUF2267 family)
LLGDIRDRTPLPPGVTPESALSAVVCSVNQHVTGGEARHLFASLPPDVQPLLAPCLIHRDEPASRFGWEGLVKRVADHLRISLDEAEDLAPAVIAAVSARLPPRTAEHVASQLPQELKELWAGPRQVPAPLGPSPLGDEVASSGAVPDGVPAAKATSVVLCALTQRLNLGEARHLVDHLPLDVRRRVTSCLENRSERPERFDRAEFFARVASRLQIDHVEPVVRAVFRATERNVPPDVVKHVLAQLPLDMQRLWASP